MQDLTSVCPVRIYLGSPGQVRDFSHGLRAKRRAAGPPRPGVVFSFVSIVFVRFHVRCRFVASWGLF